MILLKEKFLPENSKYKRFKTRLRCKCDSCGTEYTRDFNIAVYERAKHHFCTPDCHAKEMKSGGMSDQKRSETCIEKYGVKNLWHDSERQSELGKRANSEPAKTKRKETNLKRHGVENLFNRPDVRELATKGSHTPEVIAKQQEIIKKVMLERYGVRSALQLPQTRAGTVSPEAWKKRWDTLRKTGRFRTSRQEDRAYQALVEVFGADDVKRQVRIEHYSVDLYVPSIDTYVQVDGVFWHGLCRPIEQIRASSRPVDKLIAAKYDRDRTLDELCVNKKIRLVRLTDQQIDLMSREELNSWCYALSN